MTRVVTLSLLTLSILLYWDAPASAQTAKSETRHIVTTTRLVTMFSQLEQQWTNAMQQKNKAALERFLSEEFEQWTPTPPGAPLPREEWVHDILDAFTLHSFQIRQMAVRMVGETAVVSFVQHQHAECKGKDCSGESFIVDLWQQHGDAWQVVARYTSPIQSHPKSPHPQPTGKR